MAPTHRFRELLLLGIAGCAWLPSDTPPPPPPPAVDPDAGLYHDWKITGHVLGKRALISDIDSAEFHDRSVAVTTTGYTSPWSGRCEAARRAKQPQRLDDIAATHELDNPARLGLTDPIVAYQLVCAAARTPPLTVYLGGLRAATCWSGVCYLLER